MLYLAGRMQGELEMSMSENIDAFLSKRTTAERDGGVEALKALADDFYGVGPLGFVLPELHGWTDIGRDWPPST